MNGYKKDDDNRIALTIKEMEEAGDLFKRVASRMFRN